MNWQTISVGYLHDAALRKLTEIRDMAQERAVRKGCIAEEACLRLGRLGMRVVGRRGVVVNVNLGNLGLCAFACLGLTRVRVM